MSEFARVVRADTGGRDRALQEVRRADDDGHDEDDDDEPEAEAPATQRYCAMRVETGREDDGMEEEKDTEGTEGEEGEKEEEESTARRGGKTAVLGFRACCW